MQPASAEPREGAAPSAQSARPAGPEQITWSHEQWRDNMVRLPRPRAPERFRAVFPDLADWLESPWTGPPPFLTDQVFRLEETIRDDHYVVRAELPGLDPENDIEVTVDGRILTIRAERRQRTTSRVIRSSATDRSPVRSGSPPRSTLRTSPPSTARESSRSASRPARSTQQAPGSPSLTPTRRLSSRLTRPDKGPGRAGRGCVIRPRTGTQPCPRNR
jgi:HSP20 family molecular chaperone IbpA